MRPSSCADWNVGAPRQGAIAAYTSRGGTVTRPPGVANPRATDPQWCAARLEPSAGVRWNGTSETSLIRRYKVTVQKQPCPKTRLPIGSKAGAVVLAKKFKPGVPNKVKRLDVGDTVKIKMTFEGWPGATDVMGGQQMLVEKGTNVAPGYKPGDAHILDYNPRTAVGITKGCSDADTDHRLQADPDDRRRPPEPRPTGRWACACRCSASSCSTKAPGWR